MRFYNIEIKGKSAAATRTFTSFVGGKTDMGALNIELDINESTLAQPIGYGYIRVWGIDLQTISQASDFNQATVKVTAGMAPGLPLATEAYNANQQGLILQGTVFQAFGNWINTDQYLDILVSGNGGSIDVQANNSGYDVTFKANISFNLRKGLALSDGIRYVLNQAAPGKKVNININPNLILTEDEPGTYTTFNDFAAFVLQVSKNIIPSNYGGVSMTFKDDMFNVFDGTQTATNPVKQITFDDLIGQATWIGVGQIQFNTMMRGDISVGDSIKFPPALATSSQGEMGNQNADKSSFTGEFIVQTIRHVGNYRDASAESWVSVFNVATPSSGASAVTTG